MSISSPLQVTTERIMPTVTVKRKSKITHFSIAVIVAAIAFIGLAIIVSHAIIAWNLAFPYVPPLESNPFDKKKLSYEVVVYPSRSGHSIVDSWYIPAISSAAGTEGKQTVILSHGYGANREESWVPMYDLTELLNELGYNVIMFDYGYASQRYPSPATWGTEEKYQLLAAVDYAQERGAEKIIVWGFSMGGGTALQAALESEAIDALMLDSLFLPSPETLYSNINQYIGLPKHPTTNIISKLLPLWTNHSFSNEPAETVLSTQYDIPLYIMHGTADNKASVDIAEKIAVNQQLPQSQLWLIEGGQHELLFRKDPNGYMKRIAQFLSSI